MIAPRASLSRTPHLQSPARRELLRAGGAAAMGAIAPHLLLGCSHDPAHEPYEATIRTARAALLEAIACDGVPAISAALVDGERLVWAEAFGRIDKAGTAPTPQTLFAIGSVSKLVAAIAVMILVDRGLVKLEDPVAQHVRGFRMASPEYARITVRMLLDHQSGLPGTLGRNVETNNAAYRPYTQEALQAWTALRLKHAPGEMAVYCNDGFTLAEHLVAAMSGRPFDQFVHDEILAPLEMTRTLYPLTPLAPGSYAPGFTGDDPQAPIFANLLGSGGLDSTPSDMARLMMMLINDGALGGVRILSPEAVAEMGRDTTGGLALNPVTRTIRFGLGFDDVAYNGLAEVGVTAWKKGGAITAYHSMLTVAPTERLGFFVVATGTYSEEGISEGVLLKALEERGRIASVPAPLPATPLPEADPSDAQLEAMVGFYANHSTVLRMEAQPDRTLTLFRLEEGAWKTEVSGLKMRSDGTFSPDAGPPDPRCARPRRPTAYLTAQSQGLRYLVQREPKGFGHYLIEWPYAQRLEARPAPSAAWAARIGKRWLMVSDVFDSVLWSIPEAVVLALGTVPGLPGYILNRTDIADASAGDAMASMCLKIPVFDGRDLDDIVIGNRQGEEWVCIGSIWHRPLATVPALGPGSSVIAIGGEGHAEWRRLPASGTVSVDGAAWMVFDPHFVVKASGRTNASASLAGLGEAAYLLVFGAPNAVIRVTVA